MDIESAIDCIAGSVYARHLSGIPKDRRWVRSMVRTMLEGMHPRGASGENALSEEGREEGIRETQDSKGPLA